jgi:hypothetical protein
MTDRDGGSSSTGFLETTHTPSRSFAGRSGGEPAPAAVGLPRRESDSALGSSGAPTAYPADGEVSYRRNGNWDSLGPPPPSSASIDPPLVVVEASGPSHAWTLRHLGSLTERYGMPMYQSRSRGDQVCVLVPRARSKPEAEAVIASFLEQIRQWGRVGTPADR